MEYMYLEQPSIDSMIAVSQFDLDQVRSNMNAYFRQRENRKNRTACSPTTPGSPSRYAALRSHPTRSHGHQDLAYSYSASTIQTTMLIIPDTKPSSDFISSYISFDDCLSESALYTTTESVQAPSPLSSSSPASLPSLVSTPITPPTPRSPLLPVFPDLGLTVSIYRDIPFSPIEPGFTDCPFQYYNEEIPPSKSRKALQLSTESFFTAPTLLVAPIPKLPSPKPIALLQTTEEEEETRFQLHDDAEIGFDADESDGDDYFDVGCDCEDGNDYECTQCGTSVEYNSCLKSGTTSRHTLPPHIASQSPSQLEARVECSAVGTEKELTTSHVHEFTDTADVTSINEPRQWLGKMSLTEQLNELERLYTDLKNDQKSAKSIGVNGVDTKRNVQRRIGQNSQESGWSYI